MRRIQMKRKQHAKLPTPQGKNISDLPQVIAPTPVYLNPFENFVFALASAENPTHAQPIPRPGSDEKEDTSWFFKQKFASIHKTSWYKNLSASEAFSQPSGKLTPGRGHVRHGTTSSPSFVASTPPISCPLPPLFKSFRCRHWIAIRTNGLYFVTIFFNPVLSVKLASVL
ncbi:hypothetical protein H0H93_005083 [Arthromyces matolae]|nr:hypothetical protein H0H93_005083 [Arthromyces matolae]